MVTIKFNSIKNIKEKIVFCIVDNIKDYPSNWVKELVKNSIDFEICTITGEGFDVIVGYDENILLKNCANDYKFAVVTTCGTVWADNKTFFKEIKQIYNSDLFLVGHILDKKEAYYELHPQCYILNLEKYKELGYPNIGSQELYNTHRQNEPIRSIENFHDDYTPTSIKSGSTNKEYYHKCHGWNILSLGFNNNLIIQPFNENFRNNKKYLYPDNDKDITERLSEFYLENNVASRNWVNPFNTGSELNLGPTLPAKLKNLVIPANGIDWVHFLVHHGFDENTRVRFIDYNLLSLQFMKKVVEWDGVDYPSFLYNFSKESAEFLNLPDIVWLGIKDGIEEKWSEILKKYPWPSLWHEIKSKVKFEFRYKDFLHYEGPYGKDQDYWIDRSFNDPCTLISLNHVFNYHSTGVFYSLKYRVDMENYTLNKLKELVPEAQVFFDQRSWKGFRPYNTLSLKGQVKDIETVSINQLTRPTWHYNDDWSE
jgi:hypothetical protein